MAAKTANSHPAASGQGTPAGRGMTATLVNAGFGHLGRMISLLERIAQSLEIQSEYDVNYVVGGTQAGAAVLAISLPRTLHHVELSLAVDSSAAVSVALFSGNITLADAATRHNANTGPSQAICSSSGSKVTVRDYLDQTGYLTVYFTAAATTYANVRVRSLDSATAQRRRV